MRALHAALALGALVVGASGAAVPQQQHRIVAAAAAEERGGGVRVGPRLLEKPLVFPSALLGGNEGGLPFVDPPER